MADFATAMANTADLSLSAQVKAGAPMTGDMSDEHKQFAEKVSKLLESGEINVSQPESFLNKAVYDALEPEWKTKTDMSMVNVAILLGHIVAFYRSKQTPDACPQLAQMIEQLWEMKERLEVHADVFKF